MNKFTNIALRKLNDLLKNEKFVEITKVESLNGLNFMQLKFEKITARICGFGKVTWHSHLEQKPEKSKSGFHFPRERNGSIDRGDKISNTEALTSFVCPECSSTNTVESISMLRCDDCLSIITDYWPDAVDRPDIVEQEMKNILDDNAKKMQEFTSEQLRKP